MKKVGLLCLVAIMVWLPLSACAVELDQVPEAFRVEQDAPPLAEEPDAASDDAEVERLKAIIAEMEKQIQALEGGYPTPAPQDEPADEPGAEELALTDELYDYRFEMDGVVYALPMAFDALAEAGWRFENALEREIMVYPDQYERLLLRRRDPFDSRKMWATFHNSGSDAHPVAECPVAGIWIEYTAEDVEAAKDAGFQINNLTLAKGVGLLQSTADDVALAYGPPSREYDYGYALEWGYDQGYYNNYTFRFGEAGLLEMVEIWNFAAFDMNEAPVSDEPPASYAAYEPPSEMGDIRSLVFEIYGDLYRLPAPISAFEANGWVQVDLDADNPVLVSRQSGTVTLARGDDRMNLETANLEDTAILKRHACVNGAYVYDEQDPRLSRVVLPGGIRAGSGYDAVLDAYGDWISYASRYEEDVFLSVYLGDIMAITLTLDAETMTVTDWSFEVKPTAGFSEGC